MKTLEEIWSVLNAGKRITNGEVEIWYEDGLIHSDPEIYNPLLFQDKETVEDWEEVLPVDEEAALYCRWYTIRADDSIMIHNDVWYPLEKEPILTYFRMGEAYTKDAIVGGG